MFQLFSDPNHFQVVNSIFQDISTLLCVKSLQVLCINFTLFPKLLEKILNSIRKKISPQLHVELTRQATLGEHFIFIICFLKVQLYLCIYLFLHSSIYIFLSYYFSALNIFQGFRLSFARTLGRAVDKLLNGSRVTSPAVYLRAIEHVFRV